MLKLAVKNVRRRKNKVMLTVGITAITIAASVVAMSIAWISHSGLELSESRMGADILIYSRDARADSADLVFTGVTEMSYLEEEKVLSALPMELIDTYTVQFFLQTLPGGGCCDTSEALRIVGIDTASDFLLAPWLQASQEEPLSGTELIVGTDIAREAGEVFSVLNYTFYVRDKLYRTGTGLDASLFIDIQQLRKMGAKAFPPANFGGRSPEALISSCFVKLKPGVSAEAFTQAFDAQSANAETASISALQLQLREQNRQLLRLMAVLVLAIVLVAAMGLYVQLRTWVAERQQEIGYLTALGLGRASIIGTFLQEVMLQGGLGGILGAALGVFSQSLLLEYLRQLFVMPRGEWGLPQMLAVGALGLAGAVLFALLAALPSVCRFTRMDTQQAITDGEL